mgnify:CR=1 FL=1
MPNVLAFLAAEDAAVTVDWVLLTAALVGTGFAMIAVISAGLNDLTNNVAEELSMIDPSDFSFPEVSNDPDPAP